MNPITFKVKAQKWYLVDMTNFRKPVLVRKHLFSKQHARKFRNKHYPGFEIIKGKDAKKLNLRDFKNGKVGNRHKLVSKYEYPDHIKTEEQKMIYRTNLKRGMKAKKRLPELTKSKIYDILEDRPSFFIKRLKKYKRNHWVYSDPVKGLYKFIKLGLVDEELRLHTLIVRCLKKHYDIGVYEYSDVAIKIYKLWGDRIRKYCSGYQSHPIDRYKIKKEFLARGFIPLSGSGIRPHMDNYAATIWLKTELVYPELGYHNFADNKKYERTVYQIQSAVGIPGFTRAHVAGLSKRK